MIVIFSGITDWGEVPGHISFSLLLFELFLLLLLRLINTVDTFSCHFNFHIPNLRSKGHVSQKPTLVTWAEYKLLQKWGLSLRKQTNKHSCQVLILFRFYFDSNQKKLLSFTPSFATNFVLFPWNFFYALFKILNYVHLKSDINNSNDKKTSRREQSFCTRQLLSNQDYCNENTFSSPDNDDLTLTYLTVWLSLNIIHSHFITSVPTPTPPICFILSHNIHPLMIFTNHLIIFKADSEIVRHFLSIN